MNRDRQVLVFGKGRYFETKKQAIQGEIIGYIDNYNMDKKNGIPTYNLKQIKDVDYDAIYVMGTEVNFVEMIYDLMKAGIPREKIIIGQNLKSIPFWEETYMSENDSFVIDENNELCYRTNGIEISFHTYDEFYGIRDVFFRKDYECGILGRAIVIDVGMNVGAASIYFASKPNVVRVYAFEPFEPTYQTALYNIHKNVNIESKIEAFNVGVDAVGARRKITYNSSMTCGLSTDESLNALAHNMYKEWGLYRAEEREQTVQLIDAAQVFYDIFKNNPDCKYILKLDCEGAEYEILRRLKEKNLLQTLDIIMMEWHYKGETLVRSYLEECGFVYFAFPKDKNMGNIYAVRQK